MRVSRRNFLKTVGAGAAVAGIGGYAVSRPGVALGSPMADGGACYPGGAYTWFFDPAQLPTTCPGGELAADEMRITFLGTSCVPRLSQQGVSVYVEVGPTTYDQASKWNIPADYAMFDCGMGVLANYIAAGIPYSRMDKIFIAHLHGDHMSELSAIYCFGEAGDRKSPLYVWGSAPSGVPDPVTGQIYDDGTRGILGHFREVWRWHTESFSFGQNSYASYVPPTQEDWNTPGPLIPVGPAYRENQAGEPVGGDYADPFAGVAPHAKYDAYALVPIELDWQKVGGVAYWNKKTGLKITHFPAIHTRRGSMSYKVEFTPAGKTEPITMIYSGDTRPNTVMLDQAKGVDVLVHEIVMPPEQWASHISGIPVANLTQNAINTAMTVVNSSHTTQGAFGYLLGQLKAAGGLPRLTAATHFQAQDDTVALAQTSLDAYGIARDKYTFAADFMMLNVTSDKAQPVRQRRSGRFKVRVRRAGTGESSGSQ